MDLIFNEYFGHLKNLTEKQQIEGFDKGKALFKNDKRLISLEELTRQREQEVRLFNQKLENVFEKAKKAGKIETAVEAGKITKLDVDMIKRSIYFSLK